MNGNIDYLIWSKEKARWDGGPCEDPCTTNGTFWFGESFVRMGINTSITVWDCFWKRALWFSQGVSLDFKVQKGGRSSHFVNILLDECPMRAWRTAHRYAILKRSIQWIKSVNTNNCENFDWECGPWIRWGLKSLLLHLPYCVVYKKGEWLL